MAKKKELTNEEQDRLDAKNMKLLKELEKVIDDFMNDRWDVAQALIRIREEKLYKLREPNMPIFTFDEYIKDRYEKTRDWAIKLIDWYKVNQELGITNPTDALSITSSTILSPVMKNTPKKLKPIVKKAKKIAKAKGKKTPESTDIKQAKKEILKIADNKEKEKLNAEEDDYRFSIKISKDHETMLAETLEDYDIKPNKRAGRFLQTTKEPRELMEVLTELVIWGDGKVELSIIVERKPAKKSKTKAA